MHNDASPAVPRHNLIFRPLRHKTLSAYYPHLQTLDNFLHSASGTRISKDEDTEAFCDLVSGTLCAIRTKGPALHRIELGTGVYGSQQEAIDRILREIGKQACREGEGQNVLLANNRYPTTELPININRPHVENRHVHSPSSVLRSMPWRILRHRIGDDAFRRLLIGTSLFLPVGNNCFMQLSGAPIYDLHESKVEMMRRGEEEARRVSEDKGEAKKRKRSRKSDKGGCGRCKRSKSDSWGDASPATATKCNKSSGPSPAEIVIARQRMFYGRPSRGSSGKIPPGLPSYHILNQLLPSLKATSNDHSHLVLLRDIFPRLFEKVAEDDRPRVLKGSQKRVEALEGLGRELLARHAKLDYGRLFRRSMTVERPETNPRLAQQLPPRLDSSLPISQIPFTSPAELDERPAAVSAPAIPKEVVPELDPVSHKKVCRFLTLVLGEVVPASILGSQDNLDALLSHVRHFVRMKQHEPVNNHTLMQGIHVSDIPWLTIDAYQGGRMPQGEMTKRREIAGDLIKWLFDGYLIPLLKNTFYITETAATRYATVYYAQEEWTKATQPHFAKLQETLLTELDRTQAFFAQQGPLGVSAVRLIPKPNTGFRPIVNLGRKIKQANTLGIPINGSYRGAVTANQILRNVHQILTYEKTRHRAELGGSLFGTNEIFAPLQSLKRELQVVHGRIPILYFVKMDIKAAFDTIKQDRMLQIVSDLLDKNHDYCLMLYCLLLPPASKASQGSARRLFKTRAVVDNHQSASFGDHATEIAEPLRNAVIVDLVRRRHVTRESCMELLRVHIKENVWQVGKKYYRQKTGIPQGSKISSLLCSFFYACMENEHLTFTRRQGSRLLRYTDDFLFVTDDYTTARRFVETMSRGFPVYGAEISKGKTLLSFEHDTGSQMAPVCGVAYDGNVYFPYCGFLINMRTLEIMPDYPRMLTGPLRQSFALRNTRHRGSSFVGWYSRQLENRNHVAYLDTAHNTLETVYFNIFLNFALTTMKVPHYFSSGALSQQQSKLVYDALCASAEYTYAAGRARVRHASRADQDTTARYYDVRKKDFLFLAKMAMVRVLSRKAGMFRYVLDQLEKELDGRVCRGFKEKYSQVVEKGWKAVKDARY